MRIVLFGKLADVAGERILELEPQRQTGDLVEALEICVPALKKFNYQMAVNEEIVTDANKQLSPEDEIALLPPYAGG